MFISEWIVSILLLIGVSFSLLSAIGLIRLPDVYTRSHAISKSANLGVFCTLFATFLFFLITKEYISVRLFLGILFVFITSPIVAHMINRAAYRSHVPMSDSSVQDDLKGYIEEMEKQDEDILHHEKAFE